MSTAMLKDPDLAGQGRLKVGFAGQRMPVLRLVREVLTTAQLAYANSWETGT